MRKLFLERCYVVGGTSLSVAKGVVLQLTTPFVPQGVPPVNNPGWKTGNTNHGENGIPQQCTACPARISRHGDVHL